MGRRVDRIYQFVCEHANVTTAVVAESLQIQRTNASKDLNSLVKDGLLKKTDGRPVKYYIDKTGVPSKKILPKSKKKSANVFSKIIGSTGSMRNAIEQAKAAILYPPRGLNCLITGPTGSGKTFFAHAMFQFAQASQIIDASRELVTFNCSDYANNPELLMSHLFGYVKGAFTGADSDKEGLIQQADGSMLFLDEIHRLPPEGQEMIFYFMDHGSYSRLGETGKNHFADVRIVGATTEDPRSSLLDTFLRRIPINIQMPPFSNRTSAEQVDLVRAMIAMEVNRINRKITLTEDVVKALLGSVSYGNIGQLKSNVQLICARGFMNHMAQSEINITLNDLTDSMKTALVQLSADRRRMSELSPYLQSMMIVVPNEFDELIRTETYELPYNLYDIIGDKATMLKNDGLDQETINHFISTDINLHLKSFYKNHSFTFDMESRLTEFVDKQIIEVSNQIATIVNERIGKHFQQNFIYAMSLHISSFLKKIHIGETRQTNDNIRIMATNYPKEFQVAKEIRQLIAEKFQVNIPESEEYYLTVLLVSLLEDQSTGKIGIVVAAHGNSTASSMTQVICELLDVNHLASVDMPLDMHPSTAFGKIKEAVYHVNEGSGVLLIVDMGSLASFNDQLQSETGITIRTLDMLTTSLLLEAARKSSVLGSGIDELYESLQGFSGYRQVSVKRSDVANKKQVIIAICASGEGTAQRLKEIIEAPLKQKNLEHIEVLPISITDMKKKLARLSGEYKILATTGIVNPKINAPYIPMESFINQPAEQVISMLLLDDDDLANQEAIVLSYESARELCLKFIEDSFFYINPKKIIDPVWHLAERLIDNNNQASNYASIINFVMHMSGAIERSVLNQPLTLEPEVLASYLKINDTAFLNRALDDLEAQLKIVVTPSERYYIYQLLKDNQDVL
ncbi:MAG: sigma 54-interacting transcriptional regulator [Streptococcaceae bacterium]|nr:sigma 54-interacting transcriptional regulator [Streptococcaceae bacterium]